MHDGCPGREFQQASDTKLTLDRMLDVDNNKFNDIEFNIIE